MFGKPVITLPANTHRDVIVVPSEMEHELSLASREDLNNALLELSKAKAAHEQAKTVAIKERILTIIQRFRQASSHYMLCMSQLLDYMDDKQLKKMLVAMATGTKKQKSAAQITRCVKRIGQFTDTYRKSRDALHKHKKGEHVLQKKPIVPSHKHKAFYSVSPKSPLLMSAKTTGSIDPLNSSSNGWHSSHVRRLLSSAYFLVAATSSYMELLRKNFSPAHMKQPLPEFNVAATERENDEEADQDPDVVNVVEGDD